MRHFRGLLLIILVGFISVVLVPSLWPSNAAVSLKEHSCHRSVTRVLVIGGSKLLSDDGVLALFASLRRRFCVFAIDNDIGRKSSIRRRGRNSSNSSSSSSNDAVRRGKALLSSVTDVGELSDAHVLSFNAIVYLNDVIADGAAVQHSDGLIRTVRRMRATQLLVFASSGAIAEGSGHTAADERWLPPSGVAALNSTQARLMLCREHALRDFALSSKSDAPHIVGLRFGDIVGTTAWSRDSSACDDSVPSANLHERLVCAAFLRGRLRVTHLETHRSYVSIGDLTRAISLVLTQFIERRASYAPSTLPPSPSPPPTPPHHSSSFALYHVASFDATRGRVATTIAWATRAIIDAFDHARALDQLGYTLNTSAFAQTYAFKPLDTHESAIKSLIDRVPTLCLGHALAPRTAPIVGGAGDADRRAQACVVCGSRDLMLVLDDGESAVCAGHAVDGDAATLRVPPRFPRSLARCRACHHIQATRRSSPFSSRRKSRKDNDDDGNGDGEQYAFIAGVASAFVRRISRSINESLVLDVAYRDDALLDAFARIGWHTGGAVASDDVSDSGGARHRLVQLNATLPAASFLSRSASSTLRALVAWDALSFARDPVSLLRQYSALMRRRTRLFVYLTECEMLESVHFGAIQGARVSFFSAHSLQRAAQLAWLDIASFQMLSGSSCLVTLTKQASALPSTAGVGIAARATTATARAASIAARLEHERAVGVTRDLQYARFGARVRASIEWTEQQLTSLVETQRFSLLGIGASSSLPSAAPLLLDAMSARVRNHFHYVIAAEAESKISDENDNFNAGALIPGTSIRIRRARALVDTHSIVDRLLIVVFAWRRLPSIVASLCVLLHRASRDQQRILLFVPFPQPRFIERAYNTTSACVDAWRTVLAHDFQPSQWPVLSRAAPPQNSIALFSHFYNEALLLPYFILHHAPLFDTATLFDYASTDNSVDIVRRLAPASWRVLPSRNAKFAAVEVDREIMDAEAAAHPAWRLALTTTEFLVATPVSLRDALRRFSRRYPRRPWFMVVMQTVIGDDRLPLRRFESLVLQRSVPLPGLTLHRPCRIIHHARISRYGAGRHHWMRSDGKSAKDITIDDACAILKFRFTPWPEAQARALQIQTQIPQSDISRGMGFHHVFNLNALYQKKAHFLQLQDGTDFCTLSSPSPFHVVDAYRNFTHCVIKY